MNINPGDYLDPNTRDVAVVIRRGIEDLDIVDEQAARAGEDWSLRPWKKAAELLYKVPLVFVFVLVALIVLIALVVIAFAWWAWELLCDGVEELRYCIGMKLAQARHRKHRREPYEGKK